MTNIFYNKETNEYPLYIGDVRFKYPLWEESMDDPEPFVRVEYQNHPPIMFNQEVISEDIIFENGKYKNKWTIRELSEYEVYQKLEQLNALKQDPTSLFYEPTTIETLEVDSEH